MSAPIYRTYLNASVCILSLCTMHQPVAHCVFTSLCLLDVDAQAQWDNAAHRPSPQWPDEGKVVLKDYGTRYRPGLALVIKGISCDIEGGEKVRDLSAALFVSRASPEIPTLKLNKHKI